MVYDRLWWLLRRLLFLFFLFLSKLLTNDSGFCGGLRCFGRHSFRALHSGTLQVLCRKHSRLPGSVLVVIPWKLRRHSIVYVRIRLLQFLYRSKLL